MIIERDCCQRQYSMKIEIPAHACRIAKLMRINSTRAELRMCQPSSLIRRSFDIKLFLTIILKKVSVYFHEVGVVKMFNY
jgi:hypothetical protein